MKKPAVIIGKKQLVLSALTLVLGAAVYLNYALSGGTGLMPAEPLKDTVSADAAAEADDLAYFSQCGRSTLACLLRSHSCDVVKELLDIIP